MPAAPLPPVRRILCLDGGGIMGTQPASFLASLEEGLDRPIGEDAIFRCCPDVPKDFFRLDDTSKIAELRGMGAAAARKERPRLDPVFLQQPAERFEPVHKLKETVS